MPLPKVNYPILEFTIPSTQEKKKFRPIIVREEKMLLMAKSSESDSDIFNTIRQVVNNCIVDDSLNIDDLALYELEYLFLKLRGYSIGNKIELVYKDNEDEKKYTVEIDLEDVKIIHPSDKKEFKIETSPDTGIMMKFPPASLYSDEKFLSTSGEEIIDELLIHCIDYIYQGAEKYRINLQHEEERLELIQYLSSLETTTYNKLQKFFENIPHMEYIVEYENSLGKTKKIPLRTLNDFFMLR